MLTCPYNEYPLHPTFVYWNGGLHRYTSPFFAFKHRLWVLVRTVRKYVSDIVFCVSLFWVLCFKLVTFVLWLLSFMFCVLAFVYCVMYCEYRLLRVKQRVKGGTMETKKRRDKNGDVSIPFFYFLAFSLSIPYRCSHLFPLREYEKSFLKLIDVYNLVWNDRQPLLLILGEVTGHFIARLFDNFIPTFWSFHTKLQQFCTQVISIQTLVISTSFNRLQNDIYRSIRTQVISDLLWSFRA